jgi:hypothetical protein
MVGVLIAAALAALTFAICSALDLPIEVGVISAVIVLLASLPTLGARYGLRDL